MKEEGALMFHRQVHVLAYIAATLWLLATPSSVAAVCKKEFTQDRNKRSYANCSDLLVQDASIAWSYNRRSNVLAVAFSGRNLGDGWVGWGINPKCSQMVGSSVLIAFSTTSGTIVQPYKLNRNLLLGTRFLRPGPVDFDFQDTSSSISDTHFTIFTTVQLKPSQTKIRLVWNRGPFVMNLTPSPHFRDNDSLKSVAVLDVDSEVSNIGDIGCPVVGPHRPQKKKHGVIAGVAWGVLYPVGIVIGWYTICFPATFLYVYVPYHLVSFAFGMAGFYSGSMLRDLDGSEYDSQHHLVAIGVVIVGTIQLLLLILSTGSPRGAGGGLVYHLKAWFCTYNFVLGFVNFFLISAAIFGGIRLLSPGYKWDVIWLVLPCIAFTLYICNCAGLQQYRRYLWSARARPEVFDY